MGLKNRHRVKTKDISQIRDLLEQMYEDPLISDKSTVEFASIDGTDVLLIDGGIDFFYYKNELIITLAAIEKNAVSLPLIVVDMGAVKFVTNGADIMRPGIVSVEHRFADGAIVGVVDEMHRKYLAVGRALMDSTLMQDSSSGKSVENLHYVGDELWRKIQVLS